MSVLHINEGNFEQLVLRAQDLGLGTVWLGGTMNRAAYEKAMEGIYTTSVSLSTIDEAPMAYKSLEDIIDVIAESVDVVEVIKPVYNFKAWE